MTDAGSQLVQTAALTSHVSNFFKRRWSAYQERRKRQKLQATLCMRDLNDIGVRSQIEYLALKCSDERGDGPRSHK